VQQEHVTAPNIGKSASGNHLCRPIDPIFGMGSPDDYVEATLPRGEKGAQGLSTEGRPEEAHRSASEVFQNLPRSAETARDVSDRNTSQTIVPIAMEGDFVPLGDHPLNQVRVFHRPIGHDKKSGARPTLTEQVQ
jgi:hypothetical protein